MTAILLRPETFTSTCTFRVGVGGRLTLESTFTNDARESSLGEDDIMCKTSPHTFPHLHTSPSELALGGRSALEPTFRVKPHRGEKPRGAGVAHTANMYNSIDWDPHLHHASDSISDGGRRTYMHRIGLDWIFSLFAASRGVISKRAGVRGGNGEKGVLRLSVGLYFEHFRVLFWGNRA